jgi:hypothetical protein
MNGWIAATALLWLALTYAANRLAKTYDSWIERAHHPEEEIATRRVVPTSFLVVIGVAGTETLRVLRWALIVGFVLGWEAALLLVAVWILDDLTSYGLTGLPMTLGDLEREAEESAARRGENASLLGGLATAMKGSDDDASAD